MELAHIDFNKLKISKCNMRYHDPEPDVSDILPSVRQKGLLQPLIVRAEDGKFGVIAGRRRWYALKAIKVELGDIDAPPCAILGETDDAAAIEASLIENVARRDPDPMREYETFVRLIKEGRTVDGIAATFGMTATQVRQRLALGNLLPKIRDAYRADEIDDETVRHLTMASVAQQRKWLRLYSDPREYAPRDYELKQWLFGGQQVPTGHALFDLSAYVGQIVEDLFAEDRYFADADLFWTLQNKAIAEKRDALLHAGWAEVDVLEIGARFRQYEHVKTTKKKGGRVFIEVRHDGAVEIFDGWLSQKEVRKLAKAKTRETEGGKNKQSIPSGPVITQALENYLDLHRHLAVRQAIIGNPQMAFRLAVAHMAAPSGNWQVRADAQRAHNPAIHASLKGSAAQTAFALEEQAVLALLGWEEDDTPTSRSGATEVFSRLLTLGDADVLRVAAFFMARSLKAGSDVVEDAGVRFGADARLYWRADDTFFDLVRDRATVNALLADVAGESVARANIAEKAKTQKQITRDTLAGAKGRAKADHWLPGWLAFPARAIGHGAARASDAEMEPEQMAAE